MEDYALGDTFSYGKLTLLVVNCETCQSCYFDGSGCGSYMSCYDYARKDKTHVIYQDVTSAIKLVNELRDNYGEVALNQAVKELKTMNLNLNL